MCLSLSLHLDKHSNTKTEYVLLVSVLCSSHKFIFNDIWSSTWNEVQFIAASEWECFMPYLCCLCCFRVQALYVVDICIFPIKIRGSGSLARGNVCNLIYFRQSTGSNSSPFPRIRSEGSSLWFSSVLGKCWIILWIMDAEFKDFRGCSGLH